MPQTLKCLECGNEAQQPNTPVLSVHGNTFVLPEVWCCNGHRPSLMERVKGSGATSNSPASVTVQTGNVV